MKKVSILSLHMGYGGIEKSIVSLANVLCDKYDVEIACTYKLYDKPAFELDSRVKIKYLVEDYLPNRKEISEALSNKKVFRAIKEFIKASKILYLRRKTMIDYIKSTKADVIISTKDIFDRWLGDYGSSKAIKIGWEHNHHHNNKQYALNIIKSCWKLDYLVLVSKDLNKFYTKEMLKSRCKCVYIPNVIEKFPARIAKLEEKRLVSVGRLSPEKGYLDLLKIFNSLTEKNKDWNLDIVGDGIEREKLEKYIDKNNLSDRVKLHGFQNKDYIDKLLNKSSIYVMTSHTESFGIVLIEAMSHGVPCIAFSSAEGAKEIIVSGKNGYLIKNRNHGAYLKKIEDLIKKEDFRKKLGKEARQSVKKYTSDVVKEKWYNLIEKK
ncbi:MAG: glycosyltransferase family 4 protein [Firmicutes bacterium]|nr:glycosyltransferase family 4 protein [Bacillota bacterium]